MPPRKKKTLADELKSNPRSRLGIERRDPQIAAERRRLTSQAQSLALSVLRERHREEYDRLYEQAKEEVGLHYEYEE